MATRIQEIVARTGIHKVPTSVLAGVTVVCLLVAGAGFVRWGPSALGTAAPIWASSDSSPGTRTVVPSLVTTDGVDAHDPEPPAVWVHLLGAVIEPGVYRVSEGDRLIDAVTLAGGMTGNAALRSVNLARPVTDGEQVYVQTIDEWARHAEPDGASGAGVEVAARSAEGAAPTGPVNVNTASGPLLESLPGIGPATAANIIADREANGPFEKVDDLMRVTGIGEAKLRALRDHVTVG